MAATESAEVLPARHREALPSPAIAEDATASSQAAPGADALGVDHSGIQSESFGEDIRLLRPGESRLGAIAHAAYLLSQTRGFAPGHELDDWFAPERLRDLDVSEAMSKDVQACKPNDSLSIAELAMSERQVRRLPVIDVQNALIGMISLADLAREAAQESHSPKPEVMGGEIGDTLAAICQPAGSHAT